MLVFADIEQANAGCVTAKHTKALKPDADELGLIGDANPTSAEALLASRDDLIAEAEQTTDGWSPDVSSSVRRALAMLNGDDLPDDLDLRPRWRNHMHVSLAAADEINQQISWIEKISRQHPDGSPAVAARCEHNGEAKDGRLDRCLSRWC